MDSIEYPHVVSIVFVVVLLKAYLGWVVDAVDEWWRERRGGAK